MILLIICKFSINNWFKSILEKQVHLKESKVRTIKYDQQQRLIEPNTVL